MEPFLKTIACQYLNRYHNLKNFCFVFPNKRSGTFLKNYFTLNDVHSEDFPHILTISELVSQVAHKYEASRIEQLFALYNSFLEITENEEIYITRRKKIEFDDFRRWGEIVLSDFNTVDLNLVDANEIFKNVKDYKEITSNFLTDEQKEVMKEYFGVEDFSDSSEFWKQFENPDTLTTLKKQYFNLWQLLAPLHLSFVRSLGEKGLGSAGSIYKEAAEIISKKGRETFPYKKIITIGFNALSESERLIFKVLRDEEGYPGYDSFIDFVWDCTGPILKDKRFSASKFINSNLIYFPTPEWLKKEMEKNEVTQFPEIHIISAPSNTSQTKVVSEVLDTYKTYDSDLINKAEVALILPDETLLTNTLFSLPDNIGDINLTMGLSMRYTSIASFMNLIKRLYSSARELKSDWIFFSKDLKNFLSHPYSYVLFDIQEVEALLDFMASYHKISLNLSQLLKFIPNAESVLKFPSKKSKETPLFQYLLKLLEILSQSIEKIDEKEDKKEELLQIKVYVEYVESLQETMSQYSIGSTPLSLLNMIEKLVAMEKIGFEGEPIMGLQVMGTLETRSLDFRHIIIMSMNEGIIPKRSQTSTFIPETLRKAYGLPPARYSEEIFGYYFYRLLSRAEKVTLIYDGRAVSGLRGGESRYLLQLKQYAPKDKIFVENWRYKLQNRESQYPLIKKTETIREELKAFMTQGAKRKNFSASSLNSYRECEVKFFLQYILNLNSDPDSEDFMDSISIGNVLHNVMMDLYIPDEKKQKILLSQPITLDKKTLNGYINNSDLIHQLTLKNIHKLFYHNNNHNYEELESGVTEMIAEQIEDLVKSIVKYDISIAPINLYGCEISKNIEIKLLSGRNVNFRFAIDRLDEIEVNGERKLRIVDYKTGGRKRTAKDLEEVFQRGYRSEQIFQLFTYAWLLEKIGFKGRGDLMTEIYFVPDLVNNEGGLPELNGKKVISFGDYRDEFDEKINTLINNIFETDSFKGCQDSDMCGYCGFKSYCH